MPILCYFPLSPSLQGANSRLQMLSISVWGRGGSKDLNSLSCRADATQSPQLYKAPGSTLSRVYPSLSSHSQLPGPEESPPLRQGLLGIS